MTAADVDDFAQGAVAGQVAGAVVDLFEVVDVDDGQRQRHGQPIVVVAAKVAQFVSKRGLEIAATVGVGGAVEVDAAAGVAG